MWEWEDPTEGGDGSGGATDDQLAIDEAIGELRKIDLARRGEQKRIEMDINRILDDRIAMLKGQLDIAGLTLQNMEKYTGAVGDSFEELKKLRLQLTEIEDTTSDAFTEMEQQIAKLEAATEPSREGLEKLKNSFIDSVGASGNLAIAAEELFQKFTAGEISSEQFSEGMDVLRSQVTQTGTAVDRVGGAFDSLASKMGIASKAGDTTFGKFVEGASQFALAFKSSPKMALDSIKAGFFSMFSPLAIVSNMIQMMIELFQESEKAAINMSKSLNVGVADSQKMLAGMKAELLDSNISLEEFSKASTDLGLALAGFDPLSDLGTRVAKTSSQLNKMGVDTKQFAAGVQKLRFQFAGVGGDIEGASQQLAQFTMNAREMGVSATRAMSDFTQFAGSVASMGGNATEELTKLQAMSKATGVEIAKMTAIAKKFNTFKDGADAAAKLNSVFGTSISSVDLMGKTAEERNRTIADSLNTATGGYAAMTNHQRLAAAEMLGFGDDVLALQGFMEGMSAEDELAAQAKLDQAEAMEKLNTVTQEFVPILTKFMNEVKKAFIDNKNFKRSMDGIIENAPAIVNGLSLLVDVFAVMAEHIDLIIIAYGGLKAMQAAMAVANLAYAASVAAKSSAEGAGAGMTQLFTRANFGLAVQITLVAGAIALLIYLIIELAKVFRETKSPATYNLPYAMATAFLALGVALYFAGPAIVKASGAIGLAAIALSLLFYAATPIAEMIYNIVNAVVDFTTTIIKDVDDMYLFAGGLLAIGLGFIGLGKMAMIAVAGVGAGAAALLALRAAMTLSGTGFDEITGVGESVLNMGEGMVKLVTGIAGLGNATSKLLSSIGDKNLVVTSDSRQTTLLAGKGGMIAMIPPNISVDVNMDDNLTVEPPIVNVSVQIDGDQLRAIVREEIASSRD